MKFHVDILQRLIATASNLVPTQFHSNSCGANNQFHGTVVHTSSIPCIHRFHWDLLWTVIHSTITVRWLLSVGNMAELMNLKLETIWLLIWQTILNCLESFHTLFTWLQQEHIQSQGNFTPGPCATLIKRELILSTKWCKQLKGTGPNYSCPSFADLFPYIDLYGVEPNPCWMLKM